MLLKKLVFVLVVQASGQVCDDPVLLQSRRLASATCDINDINIGLCEGSSTCFECTFDAGNSTVPTNASAFPDGRLLCFGDPTTCIMESGSKVIFQSSADYFECKGNSSCKPWNVEGAGAACCSSDDTTVTFQETCGGSTIALAPGPCQNDVCCSGWQTCRDATFTGVRSLSHLAIRFGNLSG